MVRELRKAIGGENRELENDVQNVFDGFRAQQRFKSTQEIHQHQISLDWIQITHSREDSLVLNW